MAKEAAHLGSKQARPPLAKKKMSDNRPIRVKGPSDRSDTGILLAQGVFKVNTWGTGT